MKRRIGVGKIGMRRRKFYILTLVLNLFLVVQCENLPKNETTEAPENDLTFVTKITDSVLSEVSSINYHLIATKDTIHWLESLVPGDTLNAFWLYHWIDQWQLEHGEISVYGTPVIIFGDYPFDQRKPWLKMAEDNAVMDITSDYLSRVLAEFLPTIIERQNKRDSIVSADSLKNTVALVK